MVESNKSKLSKEELINLQTKFREGLVKEEELSEEVINELEKLYHRQIENLKQSIEKDKQEIIKIRNRIK